MKKLKSNIIKMNVKRVVISNPTSINQDILNNTDFNIKKVLYKEFQKGYESDFMCYKEQRLIIYFLNGEAEIILENQTFNINGNNRIALLLDKKTGFKFKIISETATVLFYYENEDTNFDLVTLPKESMNIINNSKSILVCGGAGFIGSNFINYILNQHENYNIINYDKLTYAANLDNLKDVQANKNYKFIKGDICDYDLLDQVIKNHQIDYIVNFAAETHVDRSIYGFAKDFVISNVLGVQTLLEVVKNNKDIKKFIQISTDEVYGALKLEDNNKFTEDTKFAPNSPYSATKASADLLCRAYFKTYNIPVIVTHCSNNYGPHQFPEKLIPFFTLKLLNNEKVPVYGDGLNIRDWIHVIDHTRAIDLLLDKGENGETYNIGANNEISNIDLIKMMLKIMGKDESYIEYVKDRPGHDRKYAIDATKISKLGWAPIYTKENFEQGLKETVEWYLTNKDWVQDILDRKSDELNKCVK